MNTFESVDRLFAYTSKSNKMSISHVLSLLRANGIHAVGNRLHRHICKRLVEHERAGERLSTRLAVFISGMQWACTSLADEFAKELELDFEVMYVRDGSQGYLVHDLLCEPADMCKRIPTAYVYEHSVGNNDNNGYAMRALATFAEFLQSNLVIDIVVFVGVVSADIGDGVLGPGFKRIHVHVDPNTFTAEEHAVVMERLLIETPRPSLCEIANMHPWPNGRCVHCCTKLRNREK
jgi:hypothetical protein